MGVSGKGGCDGHVVKCDGEEEEEEDEEGGGEAGRKAGAMKCTRDQGKRSEAYVCSPEPDREIDLDLI